MLVGIQPALAPSLRIGELVIVNGVTMAIVGEIVSIQRAQHTHAEVKLLVSINASTASISPGAREFPGIGAQVYRPPRDVVRAISEDRTSLKDDAVEEVRLHLAYSSRYDSLEVAFPPEKIIGRHLAVVGSSGGGKSCTVARLIEQCAMHRSKVILLDLTGEYETLEGPVFHVHLGTAHRDGPLSSATCLPFYELTEADLVAVLEPENALQLSKLQTAIRTLKLLHLEPKLGTDGVFPKAHKEKRLFDQAIDDFKHDLEVPQNLFDIYRLRQVFGAVLIRMNSRPSLA
jgi:ABC-type bacteriocin/lantibiotic exporter with double-glycine peptidase domain